MYDAIILTESKYMDSNLEQNEYNDNVLLEDQLLVDACNKIGLNTTKKAWDDPRFDWSRTKCVVFRTTWDYFHRFEEFSAWLEKLEQQTTLINSSNLIHWNIDKNYLQELNQKGVEIAPTLFVKKGSNKSLQELFDSFGYQKVILKPCISGAARHTYKITTSNIGEYASIFIELIANEDLMLQEFQENIQALGEVSLIMFDGVYSHAVLKKAKEGDFRVQDDWGGTVHEYDPSQREIDFAKHAIDSCPEKPIYARVDIMWNNRKEPLLAELELIEPELWFRRNESASKMLAQAIKQRII